MGKRMKKEGEDGERRRGGGEKEMRISGKVRRRGGGKKLPGKLESSG